jgi:hypothetical protein
MREFYVDFNTMTQDIWGKRPRVLVGRGAVAPAPRSGDRVLLTDDEMAVEGTLEYDAEHDAWWACPDWSTRVDLVDARELLERMSGSHLVA